MRATTPAILSLGKLNGTRTVIGLLLISLDDIYATSGYYQGKLNGTRTVIGLLLISLDDIYATSGYYQ